MIVLTDNLSVIVLKAELKSTNRSSHKPLVCLDVAEHNAVPC